MRNVLASLALVATGCGSPAPVNPDAAAPAGLAPAPMAWLVVVDRSVTWARYPERRDGALDALAGFLAERGDAIELAAVAFPRASGADVACTPDAYASPDLDWGSTADAILAHAATAPGTSGSPLAPALAGAGAIARAHIAEHPDRQTSIVLVTDATPNDDEACAGDWDAVAAAASGAFDRGRGAHVHVLSVIGRAVSPDHFGRMAQIADAGGGYAAVVNGAREDIAASARTALDVMADRSLCTQVLGGARPDALAIDSPDGARTIAHRVADASACAGDAFYLDDPDAPTTATLCSGEAGVGGLCELTFLRARTAGAPVFTVLAP